MAGARARSSRRLRFALRAGAANSLPRTRRSAPRITRRLASALVAAARGVPAAAWGCAAVAILNAAAWALITPPFQVPDEPSHFAYVKQLVETHSLPSSSRKAFASEEQIVLEQMHQVPYMPPTGSIATREQQQTLEAALASAGEEPREGSPAAGVATSQPPLYYALEGIPYLIAYHANLLARLTLMRLFSALFAGLTALFAFLFAREALPSARPGWYAAGLGAAFAPLVGFMSGSVNPDAMLYAVSAALFWALARAFHRGLTTRGAILIGALTAIGLVTKLNFIGLLPGALIGLALLALRAPRRPRRERLRLLAIGVGIAALPVLVAVIVDLSAGRPLLGGLISTAAGHANGSALKAAEYTWKLFLPRLPWMKPYVAGLFTTRQIWFDGFVGQYGWLETSFPEWVYEVALVFGVAILLAALRALVGARKALRRRWEELLTYLLMALGLVALIGAASYYAIGQGETYTQARYLLPLLALFCAGLALATRALGRRWQPVIATALVLLIFADDLFSQLLVVARFYG